MTTRRLHTTLLYCILIMLLAGCTSPQRKHVIGVSQCSDDSWRQKLNEELRMGEYLNDTIEVRLATADDDSQLQKRQIEHFVDEGVDLLIVSPAQMNDITEAIDRAYDKGIPVILFDRKTKSGKYSAFIGGDNVMAGKAIAKYIAETLGGRGRVVEIRGYDGSSAAQERHAGFMEIMARYPGISVVASEQGDWKEASGAKAMARILGQTRGFDFVFAHNDRMAYGAYKEAKRQGADSLFRFVGVDGMAAPDGGLQLVSDGILDATYVYPTQGDEMLKLAMQILGHQPYKRDNYLQTSIVTKDNVGLLLLEAKDAEHQREKLNVLHGMVDQYVAVYNSQKTALLILLAITFFIISVVFLVYRNYVDKARLSDQLARNNEELKRLNKEVVELTDSRLQFFTNISHELRTPLTLIVDPVATLLEDDSISGARRDLLLMVQRNALALQHLVGTILDFRKLQNGKMSLNLSRFDLAGALRTWCGDFAIAARRKHISVGVDTEAWTGGEVVADRDKISRIVLNLLINALKYTPDGGDIRVALRDEPEGQLRIDVVDNGKGIAKDDAKKVFEQFFQAKGAASGTGLGLALVKSFAELHHGNATVESKPGKGADFIITMPREQEGTVMAEGDNATAGTLPPIVDDSAERHDGKLQQIISEDNDKPTILIIDDNSDIRQYEHSLLRDHYFVIEAADGSEGLAIARKEVPDLVVCDVMMPVMDGYEFCDKLKQGTATSHIPVILLTAKNLEEQRAEGYEHGADSYIVKPFSSKVLLARIDNLLRMRERLHEAFAETAGGVTEAAGNSNGKSKGKEMARIDDRDKDFVRRLHDIINQNLSNSEFGVEDIGDMIGLSRVQLYRKVKAITGTTVVDLIRKARLQKARRLLETTKRTVSEVAYDTGFSSPSYFTKCFKDEYGVKPGEIA